MHRKSRAGAPPGFFACEAAGLAWLRVPGGPPVVEVLAVDETGLDLVRLEHAPPTASAARELGAGLARLHDAGADAFGVGPDGWAGDGFFGPLADPRPLPAGRHDRWGELAARRRVDPLLAMLADEGRLPAARASALRRLSADLLAGRWDDDDAPARLHGDLWSGNVVWTPSGAVLVDPAAHGGHRLTDLAMLHLFGAPHLADVVAGYEAAHPLPAGWRDLLALHQVHPVGMHVVLFGGGYGAQLDALLDRVLAAPA